MIKEKKAIIDDIKINDIINGLQIIERVKLVDKNIGYKCKCIKDGYVSIKRKSNLKKGKGCLLCANKVVIKGVNDLSTTHPELLKYFVNIEDAYNISAGTCL